MCNPLADPAEGEAGGDHPRAQASWLTGVHVKRTQGSDIRAGTSMDQIAAAHFSKETQLASLELALEAAELAGGCDGGYSCTYTGTISCTDADDAAADGSGSPRGVRAAVRRPPTARIPRRG